MSNRKKHSAAVIEAGPSGLAAVCSLARQDIDVTVCEAGKELSVREHDVAEDLAVGVGGAGLFSDGKLISYPSGTHVYQIEGTG